MTALLGIANRQNARLVLGGDTRQHASVVRGDALRILNTVAGVKAAEVNVIIRQKDVHYRAAVEDLSKGDVSAAFIKLSSIGAIKNVNPIKPNEDLVSDYLKLSKKGKSVLVVSPTREQGDAVTVQIRQQLKSNGKLGKKDVAALKLNNTNLTEAEKADWRKYSKGQIVQFNQNVPKIKRGSIWMIAEVNEEKIAIKNAKGDNLELPLFRASSFEVYNAAEINLAKGDKIKITRNSFDKDKKRLNNGQALEVLSVSKSGSIRLGQHGSDTGYTIDKEFGHLTHAYCSTSHSSQGKTVDHVLISQPASTFTATDAKQFYVSVSRGKESATVYTDDRKALLEYASELRERQSAIELVKPKLAHDDYVALQERALTPATGPVKMDMSINKKIDLDDYEPGF